MNVNMIKLPLIRVAHPSQQQCENEYNKIALNLGADGKAVSPQKHDDSVELAHDEPRRPEYTPHLFNFEHPYDPELTPRKKWKATVTNLDAIIEQEREKCRQLEIKNIEDKQYYESEIVKLNSNVNEAL
jgi:hypothetical protein